MTDIATREEILTEIETALQSVPGIAGVYRNRSELTKQTPLPAIILLDGEEELVNEIASRKTVRMTPSIMRMKPEIFVILQQRDNPQNLTINGGTVDAPVGPELNHWRDAVLDAINADETLVAMLTTTGQIIYRGMQTDMASGRTMLGELQLFLEFHYVFLPPAWS